MTRQRCFCLCACLTLSLSAVACGSSNSEPATSTGWDKARIGNTGVGWWVNALKSAYFLSVKISPSSQDDTTGRGKVINFTQKVAGGVTSSTADPATLVPAPDQNSEWQLDQNQPKTANGVQTANTLDSATALFDGGAADFWDSSRSYQPKALAWEVYTNGTYSLDLKVVQMASVADASSIYDDILNKSLYTNVTWTACPGTDPNTPCPTH